MASCFILSYDEYATAIRCFVYDSTTISTPQSITSPKKGPKIQDLLARVSNLEAKFYGNSFNQEVHKGVIRARQHVESRKNYSAAWKWVPKNYYSLDLPSRAKILQACDLSQLCKAMLMENRSSTSPSDCSDRTNSRFYLVIVQYAATINTKKLESEIRGLRCAQSGTRLDTSHFDFRMAKEDDSDRVTGFVHNSVTPFGLLEPSVPIVLSKAVMDVNPAFIWMGGGHVNLKLGMAVGQLVDALDAFILDVSDTK